MSAQKTELNRILEIIGKIAQRSAGGDYIYRGEPECYEKVSSNLYRKLEAVDLLSLDVERVQKTELDAAKKYTKKTDEFDLLTEIQHFGGKSNLIDFTTDYCIALFFACERFPFKNGRIILQNKNAVVKNWIQDSRDPDPSSRSQVQKSMFVRPPDGFIKPDKVIIIPKALKQALLKYLKSEHKISTETIYPDLHGFVRSQDIRWDVYAEFGRGVEHQKSKHYQQAVKHFTNVIQLMPEFAEAYNSRGFAYFLKAELDDAIVDFSKAIELNTDYTEAYNNRSAAYRDKGDFDKAIADSSKAIQRNPDYAPFYYIRGTIYDHKGELNRAIRDYTKAIELNANYTEAYNNRGNVYLRKGEVDKAIEDFNKAIGLNPELAAPYYNRATVWLPLKEWEKAETDLTTAKKRGLDVIAAFHNIYRDVASFERRNGFKLPENIVAILTQYPVNSFTTTQRFLTANGEHQNSAVVLGLLDKFRNIGKPLGEYIHERSYHGIRTGLNEAFIVDRSTRDALIAEDPVSADILKPFLKGQDVKRWRVKSQDLWLISTYRGVEIDAYPAIKKHLEKYSETLSKRTDRREWYELQIYSKDSDRFEQPKCVYPYLARETTFAFDDEGYYPGSSLYLLPTKELWLLGVLNTKAVSWFYARTTPQRYGGFLRFMPRYVSQIPIPDMVPTQKELIHKLVTYILYLKKQPTTDGTNLANARDYVMVGHFGNILSGLVYELYLPDELHQEDKHFFASLLDEHLPLLEDIEESNGDKMPAFRDIFDRLSNKHHPVERNLFFLDSLESIRIIEGRT